MSSLASRPSDPAACQLALIRTEADLITQFFLIFILGALFGKLIEARGSVESIAKYMTENSGLSVPFKPLCWRARVTYDGVRLFEAFLCSHRWDMRCSRPPVSPLVWDDHRRGDVGCRPRPDSLPFTAITAADGRRDSVRSFAPLPLGLGPVLTGARTRGSPAS